MSLTFAQVGSGKPRLALAWVLLLLVSCSEQHRDTNSEDARFITYELQPRRQHVALYWQDEAGVPLRCLGRLRDWLAGRHQRLLFAANGGMYRATNLPVGLFVEAGRQQTPLDTGRGPGNFYLPPNGVFYITPDQRAGLSTTAAFRRVGAVAYATQSGPMLVLAGQCNAAFHPGSRNLNIRNGVGILPDGHILFVMSREKINFYDFARYFQLRGCREALYLDGFVSRTYLPEKHWTQTDGDFGVMIGVTEPMK